MAVKRVESEKELVGAFRKTTAWRFITDFAELAKRVPAIDKISQLHRTDTDGKSEWFVTLDGAPFQWIQRESYLGAYWRLSFNSIGGDFDSFSGAWTLRDLDTGLHVHLAIEFELDIPVLEFGIRDEIKNRIQIFCESLMNAAVAYCAESATDERNNPRADIHTYTELCINRIPVRSMVKNASRKGLLVILETMPSFGSVVTFLGLGVRGSLIPEVGQSHYARVMFDRELPQGEFDDLCFRLRTSSHRSSNRIKVEKVGECVYPRRSVGVLVHNISAKGMLVSGPRDSLGLESFYMHGITIDPKAIYAGQYASSWRIAFANDLTEEQVAHIAECLQKSDGIDVKFYETISMAPGTVRVQHAHNLNLIKQV